VNLRSAGSSWPSRQKAARHRVKPGDLVNVRNEYKRSFLIDGGSLLLEDVEVAPEPTKSQLGSVLRFVVRICALRLNDSFLSGYLSRPGAGEKRECPLAGRCCPAGYRSFRLMNTP